MRSAQRSGASSIRGWGCTRASAAASRRQVSARPSTASESNKGRPRVRPITATLIGACALPSLRPTASAMASVTSWSESLSHGQVS